MTPLTNQPTKPFETAFVSKSNPSSPTVQTERSKTVGVEVVRNKAGWHINMSLDKVPYEHYGPYQERVTLAQALQFIATTIQLEGEP